MIKSILQRGLRYILFIILFIVTRQYVSAQYSRLSIEGKAGTNLIFGSVASLPGLNASLSLRYAPSRLISITTNIGTGLLWGNGQLSVPVYAESVKTDKFYQQDIKFNTTYYAWEGSVYMNLQKLFNPVRRPRHIIPYVYAGMGFLRSRSDAVNMETNNHLIRYVTYYTNHVGVQLKIKGVGKLDYLISAQQNFTQTPFLDGIPYDTKYDSFLTLSAGVSYQICFGRQKAHVDWTRNYNSSPWFTRQ